MTGQIQFDSHVWLVTEASCQLVNTLTPGYDGGRPVAPPPPGRRADAVKEAISRSDYRPQVTGAEADAFVPIAGRVREVFEAAARDDVEHAAEVVNGLLAEYGTRPSLDRAAGGGWTLHFHGRDDGLVVGWGAGIAAGLALAIGSDLAGRLGVCAAEPCDRVFVDTSRNSGKRFCSARCQSRVKAAAHRARSSSR